MRKPLLLLPALLFSFLLTAQHYRGEVMVESVTNENSSLELRGGYFLTDRFLLGSYLGIGDDLFRYRGEDNIRLQPYLRYYLSNRADKPLRPFIEAGLGTLSRSGYAFTGRAALGLEYDLGEGIFAKAALRWDAEINRSQTLSLDFSSAISLSRVLKRRDRIAALAKGDLIVNTDYGHLTLFDDGNSGRGALNYIFGDVKLNAHYLLTDHLAIHGSLSAGRSYLGVFGETRITNAGSLDLELGADYIFGRLAGRFQPYLGGGVAHNRYRYEDERLAAPNNTFLRTGTSPYARAGTYYHLSDRVLLNASVNYYFGEKDTTPNFSRLGINLGMKFRFGRRSEE